MLLGKGSTSCTINNGKKYTVVLVSVTSENTPARHPIWGLLSSIDAQRDYNDV